ncbi:MAG: hypothetical protein JWO56_3684 [Acidobacteria bacterium]|nr:hypothetical protein [Acidobacteriota bacterium]
MESASYDANAALAVGRRYSQAYLVARTIDAFGGTIKSIGVVIGALLAVGALLLGSQGVAGVLLASMAMVTAVCIAVVLYLLGTVVSAQGQILTATLDTAVNSSTFLSNSDRATVMNLSRISTGSPSAIRRAAAGGPWQCHCGHSNGDTPSCGMCGEARIA